MSVVGLLVIKPMSQMGLGRAITLYGGLERVAIRPVHLRPEILNIFSNCRPVATC
jgi:hypothetical protein